MAEFGNISMDKELSPTIRRIYDALNVAKPRIVDKLAIETHAAMKKHVPRGVRPEGANLKSAIALKVSPNNPEPWSVVYIKSTNHNDMIALANELGVKPRNYYIGPWTRWTKLQTWARAKSPSAARKGRITVGGPRTVLGRQNKFIQPAFEDATKFIRPIVSEIVNKELGRIKQS